MRKMKSTARREHMVAACSSSSDDGLSFGANQEEAPAPTHNAASPADFTAQRRCAFIARSIHPQVPGTLKG
jgi:hypothetical protein